MITGAFTSTYYELIIFVRAVDTVGTELRLKTYPSEQVIKESKYYRSR